MQSGVEALAMAGFGYGNSWGGPEFMSCKIIETERVSHDTGDQS